MRERERACEGFVGGGGGGETWGDPPRMDDIIPTPIQGRGQAVTVLTPQVMDVLCQIRNLDREGGGHCFIHPIACSFPSRCHK